MKTIMFWSYKGGSGRTVGAANVAAALAKLGKRVAIIDLDFEGPGLHHVFGVEQTEQFKAGFGIQHYLRGVVELERMDTEVIIDMFSDSGPLRRFGAEIPDGGQLLYVMASPKVAQVNAAQSPQVGSKMRDLLTHLREQHRVDLTIIDAASGLREAYTVAFDVSDEMLVFFRWSVQHVEGTLHMIRYMGLAKEYEQLGFKPFRLIASAAPSTQDLQSVENTELRESLRRTRADAERRICDLLAKYTIVPGHIYHEIPEMLDMKWRETVATFGSNQSPYEGLSRKLLSALSIAPDVDAKREQQ